MTEELKPCPFCGGNGKLIESHRYDASVDSTPPHWKISCECIGCNGAAINIWRQTPEDAITAWNTRHEPYELPEWLIKEVRAQIDAIIGIHFGGRYSNQKTLKRNGRIEALEWVLSLRKSEIE